MGSEISLVYERIGAFYGMIHPYMADESEGMPESRHEDGTLPIRRDRLDESVDLVSRELVHGAIEHPTETAEAPDGAWESDIAEWAVTGSQDRPVWLGDRVPGKFRHLNS